MRRSVIGVGVAALLAGGVIAGTTGTLPALNSQTMGDTIAAQAAAPHDTSMSIGVEQHSADGYAYHCQVIFTFTAGTPDAVTRYAYQVSDSELVLGDQDELPDPDYMWGDQVGYMLEKGTTFDVAAYAELGHAKRTDVAHLGSQPVSCP